MPNVNDALGLIVPGIVMVVVIGLVIGGLLTGVLRWMRG